MARNKRCFLSSTFADLQEERQAARDAIDRAGYRPVFMESFTTDTVKPAQFVSQLVNTSGVFVLVLGSRLGSKERTSGKYFVELEYEAAITTAIPVHILLSSDSRLVPESLKPPSASEHARISKFRKHLETTHTVRYWKSALELQHEVFVSLSQRRSVRRSTESPHHKPDFDTIPTTAPLSPVADYPTIVAWYEKNLAHFDGQRHRLERELRVAMVRMLSTRALSDFTVYSRTKSSLSLSGKLERPRRGEIYVSPTDVHDLIGLRVVVLHEAEVVQASQELLLLLPNAKLEVKAPSDPLAFGYRSHHITADVDQAIADKRGFRYEVQVRTLLQHTWAQIEHRLGYKSTIYDDETRRIFAQVDLPPVGVPLSG
jgi:ppGpp synthetase/RelA/SpoT-type nucleotidyltranferase